MVCSFLALAVRFGLMPHDKATTGASECAMCFVCTWLLICLDFNLLWISQATQVFYLLFHHFLLFTPSSTKLLSPLPPRQIRLCYAPLWLLRSLISKTVSTALLILYACSIDSFEAIQLANAQKKTGSLTHGISIEKYLLHF